MLVNVPPLQDEYAPLLIAYLHEEPFEQGSHWAISRIASVRPDIFEDDVVTLIPSLDEEDAAIRGYTLRTLTLLGASSALPRVRELAADSAPLQVYDYSSGTLRETTVAQLAEEFLAKVES